MRISIWKKLCCSRALNRKAPRPADAHKPLFLAMGVWAMLVPWVWVWPELVPDPAFWHAHELIFGVAGAALGGYLLIALPSWTGPNHRHRIGHPPLALLLLAWGLGRAAMLSGAQGLGLWGRVAPEPVIQGMLWQSGCARLQLQTQRPREVCRTFADLRLAIRLSGAIGRRCGCGDHAGPRQGRSIRGYGKHDQAVGGGKGRGGTRLKRRLCHPIKQSWQP